MEREERFAAGKDAFHSEKADCVAEREDLIDEKKGFHHEKEEFKVMDAKFFARKAAIEQGLKGGMTLLGASYAEDLTGDGCFVEVPDLDQDGREMTEEQEIMR